MLNIAITVPSLSVPHGGIRVIVEWANRLVRNNAVTLFCRKGSAVPSWIDIQPAVRLVDNIRDLKNCDTLITCSPHDIDLRWSVHAPQRKFLFLQMLEHLFRPTDMPWLELCNKCYGSDLPTFFISQWNIQYVKNMFPARRGAIHYVGNGVNFDDFPLEPDCKKDGKTVLVEGWESINPTKDPDAIGPTAAQLLREDGCRVLAYGQLPLNRFPDTPNEYYMRPSLSRLNDLYRRASVLIKASRYDARACAPMEAMTKGCVTVRALHKGDDDLVNDVNSVRIPYGNEINLYLAVKELLQEQETLDRLRENCLQYVREFSWDYWMPQIEKVLTDAQ